MVLAIGLAGCGPDAGRTADTAVLVVDGATITAASAEKVAATDTATTAVLGPVAARSDETTMTVPIGASVTTASLAGLAPVASGVRVADLLQPAWGKGAIPVSAAPDVVGAFRFLCTPSHNAYDDPIVYPGQPGKSHLHTFFGNTGTNAYSTYASLRTSGDGTCNNMLNRSAYWIPAMMNGRGKVVMPNFVAIYYKRLPSTDPECQRMGIACVPLPRGLRFVFGYNMSDPAKGNPGHFDCIGTGAVSGPFTNIPQAAKGCPIGAQLGAIVLSPPCWNGTELDSADHRSHLASPSYGSWGYLKCPATHPYVLPQFQLAAWYTTDDTLDRSGSESTTAQTWYFASDRMTGMAASVPGTTFHSDWFGAWEDSVMALWTANCIDKLLSCSGGDLGNGQQLKMTHGYDYGSKTVLVDIPAKPS